MSRIYAKCDDCTYKLYNHGSIGTTAFAIRHGIRQKHLVRVINVDTDGVDIHDYRAKMDTGKAPF